ncbi:hypothetical protein MTX20_32375 [Bradyrhizobium sp. ISRA435]|nr:hypothetical protein MTX20_32375 [Bradyrhizobium sp. ISRA435]
MASNMFRRRSRVRARRGLRGGKLAGKVDRLRIEAAALSVGVDDLEERHRQQGFRTCEEVEILDVSDGIEIRPAGIVGGYGLRQGGDIKHARIVLCSAMAPLPNVTVADHAGGIMIRLFYGSDACRSRFTPDDHDIFA